MCLEEGCLVKTTGVARRYLRLVPVRVGAVGTLRARPRGTDRTSVLRLGARGSSKLGPSRGHGAALLLARFGGGLGVDRLVVS